MTPQDREVLARRHGFIAYDDMIAASISLPPAEGDKTQSYVGRDTCGHLFIWKVPRATESPANDEIQELIS